MNPEEKELLKETHDLSKENNDMLRAIRRSMLWGRITKFIYWAIIIGISIGAFYYIQPYVDTLVGTYGGVKGDIQNFSNVFN